MRILYRKCARLSRSGASDCRADLPKGLALFTVGRGCFWFLVGFAALGTRTRAGGFSDMGVIFSSDT